jgi:uncharacterized membrane protein
VALLLLPGYTLALFLLPRFSDLDGFERTAMAVGLSLAQYPLLAVALDHSPWGLSPTAIITSLMLVTLVWGTAATVRLAVIPSDELLTARRWLRFSLPSLTRLERLAALAGLCLLTVVTWSVWTLVAQPPLPPLTEFFMLGPEGLAQNYPNAGLPNQPISVTLAVRNLEGQPVEYAVIASHEGADLARIPPFRVEAGETHTDTLTFALPEYGFGQRLDVLLFRSGLTEPYRRLVLLIDVPPPGVPTPVRIDRTPQPTVVRADQTAANPVVPTPAIRVIRTPGP